MDVVDPREKYDDLIATESREVLEPEEFEETADSEAATVGWVVLGFVFDDRDRILLIDQPWADGWTVPGGVLEPGESLSEAVDREVREETGVEITPVRPQAVDETTAIKSDLGLEDETIDDAGWYERLPEDVFHHELTEAVYRRCLDDDPD